MVNSYERAKLHWATANGFWETGEREFYLRPLEIRSNTRSDRFIYRVHFVSGNR